MFKIGEKVVCVNDSVLPNGNPVGDLKKREIYTVIEVCFGGVALKEVQPPMTDFYSSVRFRKLDHTFAEEVTARIEEEINQENLIEA